MAPRPAQLGMPDLSSRVAHVKMTLCVDCSLNSELRGHWESVLRRIESKHSWRNQHIRLLLKEQDRKRALMIMIMNRIGHS